MKTEVNSRIQKQTKPMGDLRLIVESYLSTNLVQRAGFSSEEKELLPGFSSTGAKTILLNHHPPPPAESSGASSAYKATMMLIQLIIVQ
ncbi:hypothetical protein Nepgr_028277 [Nepenthes gracilis]|uniref:Uncharacterized protein n=1 Tax=Nepenthes gracilis TaxID=150966 RepID=A0AAD3TCJ1_NEPGR|nr:hypothetical protein Nepgr_028277 [Nepenthes gracilis]